MLPDALSIQVKDHVIYWTNKSPHLTEREALEVSTRIKSLAITGNYKALIVDNRMLRDPWQPEVDRVWVKLLHFVPTCVEKTVTLCDSVASKTQLNYLSKQAGTENTFKAFAPNEHEAITDFLKPHQVYFEE